MQLLSFLTSALDGAEYFASCSGRCISKIRTLKTGKYRGADKSLARPGRKLMFLSEWLEFPSALCLAEKKKLYTSLRLDVVEIARDA